MIGFFIFVCYALQMPFLVLVMIKYFHMFLVYAFWTRVKAVFDFQSLDKIDFRGWYDFSFPLLLGWLCLVSKKFLKKDGMFFSYIG